MLENKTKEPTKRIVKMPTIPQLGKNTRIEKYRELTTWEYSYNGKLLYQKVPDLPDPSKTLGFRGVSITEVELCKKFQRFQQELLKQGRLHDTLFTWHEVNWSALNGSEAAANAERVKIFDFKNAAAKAEANKKYKAQCVKADLEYQKATKKYKISGLAQANAKINAYLFLCGITFCWLVFTVVYIESCNVGEVSYCSLISCPTLCCHLSVYLYVYCGVHKKKKTFKKEKQLMFAIDAKE